MVPRGKEAPKGDDTKEGTACQYRGREGKRNGTGRTISGRSAVIVPMDRRSAKQGNRNPPGPWPGKQREGLRLEKELMGGNTMDTQRFRERVSTKQHQTAKTAEKYAGESLTNVARHIDAEWMHCAYEMTRPLVREGVT